MSTLSSAGWRPDLLDGRVPPNMKGHSSAPESTEMVAERLKLLREALGFDQAEMCRRTGIGVSAWNNAETGDNRIGITNAIKVRQAFGVGLDYIFMGDQRALPSELATKIGRLNAPQRGSRRA